MVKSLMELWDEFSDEDGRGFEENGKRRGERGILIGGVGTGYDLGERRQFRVRHDAWCQMCVPT